MWMVGCLSVLALWYNGNMFTSRPMTAGLQPSSDPEWINDLNALKCKVRCFSPSNKMEAWVRKLLLTWCFPTLDAEPAARFHCSFHQNAHIVSPRIKQYVTQEWIRCHFAETNVTQMPNEWEKSLINVAADRTLKWRFAGKWLAEIWTSVQGDAKRATWHWNGSVRHVHNYMLHRICTL